MPSLGKCSLPHTFLALLSCMGDHPVHNSCLHTCEGRRAEIPCRQLNDCGGIGLHLGTVGCHKVWRGQAYRLGMHSFFVNGMVSNQDGLQVVAKEAKRS